MYLGAVREFNFGDPQMATSADSSAQGLPVQSANQAVAAEDGYAMPVEVKIPPGALVQEAKQTVPIKIPVGPILFGLALLYFVKKKSK